MSGFLRLIGSLCIFAFIAVMFIGSDIQSFFSNEYKSYANDLINNKWMLVIIGVLLSIVGSITKVRKQLKKSKNSKQHKLTKQKYSVSNLSSNTNEEFRSSKVIKKAFAEEQYQHKTQQFIDTQTGHLKELAQTIDWTPLRGGGANFKTSFLKRISSSRIEVARSKGCILFSAIFIAAGSGVMSIGAYTILKENRVFDGEILFPLIFGSVFAVIGFAMLYWPRPRVFDLRQGWFWAGKKSLAREQDFMKLAYTARLSDIAVLQVIPERVSGSKGGSYTSWEINLVSKDGERLNVMDHGKYESIIADAEMLGDFLGVPVWENT